MYFCKKLCYNIIILKTKEENKMDRIVQQLKENGYDYGVAIATQSEIENGAACGQLSIIIDQEKNNVE